MTSKTITLKHANQIFPSKYTKIRSHDLISMSVDNRDIMTKREQQKLVNMADDIRGKTFGGNQDIMATRTGTKIKFENIFDD